MKATFKSVAIALSVLAIVIVILTAVDGSITSDVSAKKTYIKVCVVDLEGNPVHNARVTVLKNTFNTDNKGLSPSIEITAPSNCYDADITDWHTITVSVQKTDYVSAVVFNCIVYDGQTRKLTVKIYPADGSDLPYTVYVESPPDSFVKNVLGQ